MLTYLRKKMYLQTTNCSLDQVLHKIMGERKLMTYTGIDHQGVLVTSQQILLIVYAVLGNSCLYVELDNI